ncbi:MULTISPECIES: YbgA family protein [Pseudoalteromonas]|uniref:DUF1722 domain-containing protein n=1 Tax=Pseudoalteromonas luteoviolacea (strain 2ta16) TaxID=1353533 RepID=V4JHL9_PSEL2|nr:MULTISPECIES: DUF523 and DUF1722 domain-containing protein [Pseudoalteromonas]ESP94417.1 hypothetical protein PL2TA16_00417 [Pseudoalteromonas luteoviolacea 2ta16]KZN32110.1 hypothetical protein N483_02925 [Pseudoalteromonas luteoviolacea NCIMB 1944]MCG7547913.1 DUF523 and DUF1722 domain-containing protein [Pseudoalteromonas sp. Of7M-16]
MQFNSPIQIGLSACLGGDKVRFDKGHKRSNFCMDEFSKHVEFVKFCPEVAIGMPIPRETIRQVRFGDTIKVCRPDGTQDVGPKLTEYGKKIAQTKAKELSGFVFCAKSPSCGMERVKVYNDAGTGATAEGVGAFAAEIMRHNPLLPCEENGRLNDVHLRENFVMRVYVYKSWQELTEQKLSKHKLTEFHAKHKYLLMSHNYEAYRKLGRLLAEVQANTIEQGAGEYILGLMEALKKPASRKAQANTLAHLQGYFKNELSQVEKAEMVEAIDEYRTGLVPLNVPLTLLKHHLRVHPKAYLEQQVYFDPYPHDLKLRFAI